MFDSINELTELDENYIYIRQLLNFHIAITSRISEFEQINVIKVDALPVGRAIKLFETHAGNQSQNDHQRLTSIYHAIGGNTLVIEILAKNLRSSIKVNPEYRLEHLLANLQRKGLLQLDENHGIWTDYKKLKRTTPRDVVEAIYDLEELDNDEKKCLSLFALLPAVPVVSAQLTLLVPAFNNINSVLASLSYRGWLVPDADHQNKYRINQVVRDVLRHKLRQLWQETAVTVRSRLLKLVTFDIANNIVNLSKDDSEFFVGASVQISKDIEDRSIEQYELLQVISNYYRSNGRIDFAQKFALDAHVLADSLSDQHENDGKYTFFLGHSKGRLGQIGMLYFTRPPYVKSLRVV